MLPRISLLLLFLWGNGNTIHDDATPTMHAVEAFSTLPIDCAMRPARIKHVSNAVAAAHQRSVRTNKLITTTTTITTAGSSSSLTAWRSSFGSARTAPKVRNDGLYHITTEEEYRSLLKENPDKLIVMKVFSPWCKTCKALAPKFQALARRLGHNNNENLPIIWVSLAHSKDNNCFVRTTLGVNAVPSVLLYEGDGVMVDCFPCGPSKVATILRPKLVDLISNQVDLSTGRLHNCAAVTTTTTTTTTKPVDLISLLHQSSLARGPIKMVALLCQILRSKWQRLVGAHHSKSRRHQHPLPTNGTVANAI